MMDKPLWEKLYSREISAENPLDPNKPRGYAIIYAPEIAQRLRLDKHTLFYFTWSSKNAKLRVYDSESPPPKLWETKDHKYSPADVIRRIVRGITLPNSHRPDLECVSYWYNYIQNKKKQWFPEESADEPESPETEGKENKATDNNVPDTQFNLNHSLNRLNDIRLYLMDHKSEIYRYFYTTEGRWCECTQRIKGSEAERLWVFLIGCSYALGGKYGMETLTRLLTCVDLEQPSDPKIWFECLPLPPRMDERNTSLDLALGAIARRKPKESGIRLDDLAPSWICFCEAKFGDDIKLGVEHDPNRNQLARVIENALCFQNSGIYADNVYVTIVTPKVFEHKRPLLERKFNEYKTNPRSLVDDLIKCPLIKRSEPGWFYPSENVLTQRVMNNLKLRRVYFGDLVKNLPSSDISEQVKSLWYDIM